MCMCGGMTYMFVWNACVEGGGWRGRECMCGGRGVEVVQEYYSKRKNCTHTIKQVTQWKAGPYSPSIQCHVPVPVRLLALWLTLRQRALNESTSTNCLLKVFVSVSLTVLSYLRVLLESGAGTLRRICTQETKQKSQLWWILALVSTKSPRTQNPV